MNNWQRFMSSLAFTAGLGLISPSAMAEPHAFGYKDLVSLSRLSSLSVAPDGSFAIFQVRATDLEKNKGVTSIYIKDLKHSAQNEWRLPASDGGASAPQLSADGQWIYFLSSRSGSDQVWRTDRTGAKAVQVTDLPLDVGVYKLSPDGKAIIVSLAVFPNVTGDEIAGTLKKQAEIKAQKSSGIIYDRLFVRHWDTWADGTRNHLFALPISSEGKAAGPVALTQGFDGDMPSKPDGGDDEWTISPDSKTLFVSVREAGKSEPWSTNFDIYQIDLSQPKAMINLTKSNLAWDAAPRVSPDGTKLAYKAMKRPTFEADRFWLYIRDLKTGVTTEIAPHWDRSIDALEWAKDGKSLLLTADDTGQHRLWRLNFEIETNSATSHTVKANVRNLTDQGHIDAFAETPNGFVFLKSGLNGPSQLYRQADAKSTLIDDSPVALTDINRLALMDTHMGQFEQFSFKGWNGETVHGYVMKPADFEPGKSYPLAFIVHGGPQVSFSNGWSYRWNPQTYAGEGFGVVFIDFHGSPGYGQAFTDAISEHWGDRPLEDLQKGMAYALDHYKFLDGSRACALGASYGGYMINWIAGNWKKPDGVHDWGCLVEHDGIFDTRTMAEETEELWFQEWEDGGMVYTNAAKVDNYNPALHAKDWSIPQLVIHSDKDYRVVPGQGIATFTALQRQGIESKFLRFPDENHWVLKPQNSLKWHETVMGWLKTHTQTPAK